MKDKNYDDAYLKRFMVFFQPLKNRSYNLLKPQPTDLIVDVGCGMGDDAVHLATSGATVYGIDHDLELINMARQQAQATNAPVQFLCIESNAIPLDTGMVDKLRYDRIFQHLPNHEATLTEAHRLLKPDGLIQIIDPDYQSMTLFLDDDQVERKIMDSIAYQRLPNANKVRRLPTLLRKMGFDVELVEVHNYLITDFTLLNYAIRFTEQVAMLLKKGTITEVEYDRWKQHINRPAGQFTLSLNMLLIMARKSQNS